MARPAWSLAFPGWRKRCGSGPRRERAGTLWAIGARPWRQASAAGWACGVPAVARGLVLAVVRTSGSTGRL
jgi:hypothetical protein